MSHRRRWCVVFPVWLWHAGAQLRLNNAPGADTGRISLWCSSAKRHCAVRGYRVHTRVDLALRQDLAAI
jgi:hypothetical protein